MIMQPFFGMFSDRFGRKTSMLLFGGLATLCTVPLMYAIADVKSPLAAYGLIIVALAIVSFYTSISGLVKSEMFPPEVRAMSVGLAYAIANAIFGGSAEYVALWFKNSGAETSFLLVRDFHVRHRFRRFDPDARPEDQRLSARRGNRNLAVAHRCQRHRPGRSRSFLRSEKLGVGEFRLVDYTIVRDLAGPIATVLAASAARNDTTALLT